MIGLREFEEEAIHADIETACVILSNGVVYKSYGISDRIFVDDQFGERLKGAIVSHNHPIVETHFSFSHDDFMALTKNISIDSQELLMELMSFLPNPNMKMLNIFTV